MSDYSPTRFSVELTSRLRGHIARHDVNQSDLAKLCDVSQSQFSKIIRGVRPMTVDQLAALCEALDIDPVQLISEVEEFLSVRNGTKASPVQYVVEGERVETPVAWGESDLDAWALKARARLDVGGAPQDYDLVANDTIDETPGTMDADYDNA